MKAFTLVLSQFFRQIKEPVYAGPISNACGKISFADGWGSQKSMTMMFLLAALDIKRHHQNESKTKEVIFPLEEPCQQMSELPQNFWRTNAQKR